MTNTALITGASGGIGAEMARYHASKGGDMVLVARKKDRLEALKSELENHCGVKAEVVPADLARADAAKNIFQATREKGLKIDILINNAGFGGHGKFYERDHAKDQAMMQVNMVSLVNLTHIFLQGMVKRNHGRILHVASTAAFIPGPLQAVYYATKSFVVSFSQAIAKELEGTNVSSTVLCPGPVATGFVAAGDLDGVKIWDKAASPESVAKCGYQAMEKGELVKLNEKKMDFLFNWVAPFLSRKTILKMSRQAMEKR